MGSSRQEYWRGLPFPLPGDLPDAGIEPTFLTSFELAGRFLPLSQLGSLLSIDSKVGLNFYSLGFIYVSCLKGLVIILIEIQNFEFRRFGTEFLIRHKVTDTLSYISLL